MLEFDFGALSTHDRYNLIIGLVTPRPIALVTTLDASGRVNAAPYSAFNYAGVDPVLVTIGAGNRADAAEASGLPLPKDTAQNIRVRGEFVINVVNEALVEAMNVCAIDFPPDVDELAEAGLTTAPSSRVKVPRIAEAPARSRRSSEAARGSSSGRCFARTSATNWSIRPGRTSGPTGSIPWAG